MIDMNELNRKQVSLIFKARTRMLKIKANYKNGNTDQKCRACKIAIETQERGQRKDLHDKLVTIAIKRM